ncbi:hypothetical protein CP960_02840 [Malaciobacter halophilus]|uniref:Uncharacterized protein n=3 Tax=Malaciobacter TaxID=2321114 RepID=A0A2N1J582_9BACT|nr:MULTISPECIES: hypothetical protein [Malaciobacter]AXH10240.1 hypothetical protein AHALO_1879 [Malaciobacter halophilus]AXX87642.1 hypothetical protein AMRN_1919 [Malaciobacter marinus]PKI81719.1 hypothetical protein CP960_02840 [Malaciobacter halophilus]
MFKDLDTLDKSRIYNIFIVRTPFQLINAYETKYFFKKNNAILIIIDNGTENNKHQLTNLIYDDVWEKVIRFGDENKSNFLNYIKLIKKLNKINIDSLFIGSGFNKMQQVLVANINSKYTCFFDSGTNTMTTYNAFVENNINFSALKKMRFKIFGLKTKIDKKIDFFTMFDLKELANHKIYKNNYEFMKNKFLDNSSNVETKEIYIIGQRFVNANILSADNYSDFLNKVCLYYKDYKINYLMHRTETDDFLIKYDFDKKMNIIKSEIPGELFFLSLKNRPKYIIGTVSTLLVSLKYIFPNIAVKSYKFDINSFNKNKELYTLEYDNLKKNKVEIINFEDSF